jgi:hypothetical protein
VHETVTHQGLDGFSVEVGELTLGLGHETQRPCSALPEGALEPRLLA